MGRCFNEGIAISRETLVQLETHLALVQTDAGMEYEDEVIDWRLVHPLRRRREVQGGPLEHAGLRGALRGAGSEAWSGSGLRGE